MITARVPVNRNGQTLYVMRGAMLRDTFSLRGLGDATSSQTATAANILLKATGAKSSAGITQTTAGQVSQDAEVAGQIAVSIAPFFSELPPVAVAIAAAGTYVIVASKVVDAIWGTNKDKATMAQAGQVNALNATLRNQILQVNQQTNNVTNALQQVQSGLQQSGFSGFKKGLGDAADDILANAYASNADLQSALDQKVATLTGLIENFNTAMQQANAAINGKSTGQKVVLFGLIALVIVGLGWYGLDEL